MVRIRRTIRKGFRFLRARGFRKTIRRAVLHLNRKKQELCYVKQMMPSAETLAMQRTTDFQRAVRFSVIVPLNNTPLDLLREMVESVQKQSYERWELCLADGSDAAHSEVGTFCQAQAAEDSRIRYRKLEKNEGISGNTNAALEMATGDYIVLFDHDDLLRPDALYEMAREIETRNADFLYSDEMIFVSPEVTRIIGIRFKPDFAPEELLTNNYICHLTVFRRELLEKAGRFRSEFDGSQDHDLVLRLTAAAERVVHVPKVLYMWRSIPGSVAADIHMKEYAIEAGRHAVETFLHSRGWGTAQVESTEVFPTMYRIRFPIEGNPSVRILLSADRLFDGRKEKLQALCEKTTWKNCIWEILSSEEKMPRGRRFAEAAQRAGEDYLLFVDGIPETLTPDWVQEMLMWAQQEAIGAVGAKMRFARGIGLRNAGIILGLGQEGIAGRSYFDREDDQVGYFGQLAIVRNISVVTDCWMVKREKFEETGGFDPQYGEALFDIDFCMKLRKKGLRNLWTPNACLREGQAKDFFYEVGKEFMTYPKDREIFAGKWAPELQAGDPYYNPNLSLQHEEDWHIG